jgi:hypothetical protein
MARRPAGSNPAYRLHKATGLAIVSLPQGDGRVRDVYLGTYEDRPWLPDDPTEVARLVLASDAHYLDAFWQYVSDWLDWPWSRPLQQRDCAAV